MRELGKEGLATFKKSLKFGDLVVNHYASEDNPNRCGYFVMFKKRSILLTDKKGNFFEPAADEKSKLENLGGV